MQCVALPQPDMFYPMVTVQLISDYCNNQAPTSTTTTTTRCKVVRIPYFKGARTKFYAEIFCCETWEWSGLCLWCPRPVCWTNGNAVVCNGMLLWLSCDEKNTRFNGFVAYNPFNNSTNQCHFIDLPKDTKFVTPFIGVCQGHLRLCHMSEGYNNLSVWDLKEFSTGEWCLQHKIDFNFKCPSDAMSFDRDITPRLYIDPSDEDVVYLMYSDKTFLFEMKSKKLRSLELVFFNDMLKDGDRYITMAIPFVLLWRPTPVPTLQSNALQQHLQEIERKRQGLQAQEKKLITEIKKNAKQGQMGAVRVMAKDLIRTRHQIEKFYKLKSQLQDVGLRIQILKLTQAMEEAMKGDTKAMGQMNRQMNLPSLQKIIEEFADALEGNEEELVNQVLDEIGIDINQELANAPSTAVTAPAAKIKVAQAESTGNQDSGIDDDLQAK